MTTRVRVFRWILVAAVLVLGGLPTATPAQAATIVVNTGGDGPGACPATCTLRAAITAAAANDTITFASGLPSPITLGSGELLVNKNLTIQGPTGYSLAVSGNNAVRVFHLTAGNLTITDLTIQNGADSSVGGAGFYVEGGGALTLTRATVKNNVLGYGSGGGVYNNGGTVILTNVTLSGNSAAGSGGGISNSGVATLTNVTLDTNSAGQGGGLSSDQTATLANVSIFNNSAQFGGGVRAAALASLIGTNLTVSGNSATTRGGGIDAAAGTTTLQNSSVANNTGGDCGTALVSQGHNLEYPGNTCGFNQTSDVHADPLLGALRVNAPGRIATFALLPGSAAIDAGDPGTPGSGGTACAATDERGIKRPKGLRCDIGAYEFVPRVTGQGAVPVSGGSASFRVEALNPAGGGAPTGSVTWQAPTANVRSSSITSLTFSGNATTSTATISGACTNLTTRQSCTYTLVVSVPLVGGVPSGTPSVTLSLDGGTAQGGALSSGTAEIGTARSGE